MECFPTLVLMLYCPTQTHGWLPLQCGACVQDSVPRGPGRETPAERRRSCRKNLLQLLICHEFVRGGLELLFDGPEHFLQVQACYSGEEFLHCWISELGLDILSWSCRGDHTHTHTHIHAHTHTKRFTPTSGSGCKQKWIRKVGKEHK